MPDDGVTPSAVDTSMADAPNVGKVSQEINRQPKWAKALSDAHARRAAERPDNWQPLGSLAARLVANSLRQMEERDDG